MQVAAEILTERPCLHSCGFLMIRRTSEKSAGYMVDGICQGRCVAWVSVEIALWLDSVARSESIRLLSCVTCSTQVQVGSESSTIMSITIKRRSRTHANARSRTISMRVSLETGRLAALTTLAHTRLREWYLYVLQYFGYIMYEFGSFSCRV